MMHMGGELPYATGTGWQAVELPYVGGKLSMLVIVPDDLAAFEKTLDGASLAAIVDGLATRHVSDLGLPKFGTESKVELKKVLSAMGMPTAFTDRADFSGISTEEPLLIDAVIHQANIDVDENGTEAAAATAVVARAQAGARSQQIQKAPFPPAGAPRTASRPRPACPGAPPAGGGPPRRRRPGQRARTRPST